MAYHHPRRRIHRDRLGHQVDRRRGLCLPRRRPEGRRRVRQKEAYAYDDLRRRLRRHPLRRQVARLGSSCASRRAWAPCQLPRLRSYLRPWLQSSHYQLKRP